MAVELLGKEVRFLVPMLRNSDHQLHDIAQWEWLEDEMHVRSVRRYPMTHTTLRGPELDLTSLTVEEAAVFDQARQAFAESPEWHVFKQKWLNEVLRIYDRQNLPRREAVSKPLYRAVQDLGSRLMVEDGYAKMPSYREQIAAIIEAKFETRREFCEATGLSEDMLSHVLKGRKDVSLGTLTESLQKIGYAIAIVPLPKNRVG